MADREPQPLAPEEELPPDADLVRFGVSELDTLRDNALAHADDREDRKLSREYACSCDFRLGATVDEIAMRSTTPNAENYRRLRRTTVARVNVIGLRVVWEGDRPGHGRIELGAELADDKLEELRDVFDLPEDNPRWNR